MKLILRETKRRNETTTCRFAKLYSVLNDCKWLENVYYDFLSLGEVGTPVASLESRGLESYHSRKTYCAVKHPASSD